MRPLLLLVLLAGCADRERFFIATSDGALLHATADGPADATTTVLVLHGGPYGDSAAYNVGRWSARLEEDRRMVYLDQRGQGASRGTWDLEDYTPQRAADDVAEAVSVLRARYGADQRLILLGHSWGGMLGSLALLDTDVRVDGWIEVAGCHDAASNAGYILEQLDTIGSEESDAGRQVEGWREVLDQAGTYDPEDATYLELVALNRLGHHAEDLIEDIEWDEDIGAGGFFTRPARGSVSRWAGALALSELRYAIEEISLNDRLHEIDVPTLLLWGRYDFVCPPAHGLDALARIPDARWVELEHSGHSVMLNEPEAFVDAVDTFLDER